MADNWMRTRAYGAAPGDLWGRVLSAQLPEETTTSEHRPLEEDTPTKKPERYAQTGRYTNG